MNPSKKTKICKFNFWKVTCGFHMCQNVISNMMFEIKRPGTQDFGTRHGQGYIFQHCNLETPLKYYITKSGRYWIGLSSLHLAIQIPQGPRGILVFIPLPESKLYTFDRSFRSNSIMFFKSHYVGEIPVMFVKTHYVGQIKPADTQS